VNKISNLLKLLGMGTVALMVLVHIGITILDIRTLWPLSPYNMFNQPLSLIQTTFRAILISKSGRQVEIKTHNLFPVEYFKNPIIAYRSLSMSDDDRDAFYRMVLEKINRTPHVGFDEVHASPSVLGSDPYVGIKLIRVHYNLNNLIAGKKFRENKKEVIVAIDDHH
jgi:hypothetical protein